MERHYLYNLCDTFDCLLPQCGLCTSYSTMENTVVFANAQFAQGCAEAIGIRGRKGVFWPTPSNVDQLLAVLNQFLAVADLEKK